jgi:hypothetical protein
MKKILLSIGILFAVGTASRIQAQCEVAISNVAVQVVTAVPLTPTTCQVTVNVKFNLDYNSGAKFVYFNSYLASDYSALAVTNPLDFDCSSATTPARNAPDAGRLGTTITQIGKSFLDVGVDLSAGHGALNTPIPTTVLTSYLQDPTVALNTPANSGGFTVTRTFLGGTTDLFEVENLVVVINQACAPDAIAVETDVWASNANASNAKAQCYVCGVNQFFNDPKITGFKNCNVPRQYTIGITTVDPALKTITYKVYLDVNDNGTLEDLNSDGIQDPGDDLLAFTSANIDISSSQPFSAGPISLPVPYSNTQPYSEMNYLVLVEGATLSNDIIQLFEHPDGCIGLPVEFKSFTATRNRSNVVLKWETATEIDNTGFSVLRNIGGTWQEIAFVPTQAQGGNSTITLVYTFNDPNTNKGITQYRIKQIDNDGKFSLSDIRAVRGDGQIGKTIVFPNPTNTGNVTIVFEDANVKRDISIIDMAGKVIKQWRNVTNNNLQVENLPLGVFSVRILAVETGEQVVEKIVVNKR